MSKEKLLQNIKELKEDMRVLEPKQYESLESIWSAIDYIVKEINEKRPKQPLTDYQKKVHSLYLQGVFQKDIALMMGTTQPSISKTLDLIKDRL